MAFREGTEEGLLFTQRNGFNLLSSSSLFSPRTKCMEFMAGPSCVAQSSDRCPTVRRPCWTGTRGVQGEKRLDEQNTNYPPGIFVFLQKCWLVKLQQNSFCPCRLREIKKIKSRTLRASLHNGGDSLAFTKGTIGSKDAPVSKHNNSKTSIGNLYNLLFLSSWSVLAKNTNSVRLFRRARRPPDGFGPSEETQRPELISTCMAETLNKSQDAV